jgi:hypothetical protein
MTPRSSRVVQLALLTAVALSSCNGCEEEVVAPPSEGPAGERHMIGGVPVGTVEGIIRLAEGAEVPSYPDSPFATRAAGEVPASCTPPQIGDRQPLRLDASRGLANVAVGAMGDPSRWIEGGEPVTHEVHIRDCRIDPMTIVAMRGDRIRMINEVDYPFMPQFGLGFLQAVTPAEPLERELDQAGPRTLECAFAAPCGRAEIMVFQTPVYAVSGPDGTFRIENAPADLDLTIVAWHPLIEEARATTRVEEGGTVHVEIIARPHGAAAPTEPTPLGEPDAPTSQEAPTSADIEDTAPSEPAGPF